MHKQVIVIRVDLGMSRGKMVVQGAHASVSAVMEAMGREDWRRWLDSWLEEGQKKIAVRVGSEEELRQIYLEARDAGLPSALIMDAGLTELPPGTATAVAVGPAPEDMIDPITGRLKLL